MDCTMREFGISIGKFTDLERVDDGALFAAHGTLIACRNAVEEFDTQPCDLGLQVSWIKTRMQHLGCGDSSSAMHVETNIVETLRDLI